MFTAATGCRIVTIVLLAGMSFAISAARGQAPPSDPGRRVYEKANCVGCHKWHGGGGYGGAALSLRETTLERVDLIEVIRCGRPATASSPRCLRFLDRENRQPGTAVTELSGRPGPGYLDAPFGTAK